MYLNVLWCVAVCCGVLQCVVVLCSVLQCAAVCCSMLQCVTGQIRSFCENTLAPPPMHLISMRYIEDLLRNLRDHIYIYIYICIDIYI